MSLLWINRFQPGLQALNLLPQVLIFQYFAQKRDKDQNITIFWDFFHK